MRAKQVGGKAAGVAQQRRAERRDSNRLARALKREEELLAKFDGLPDSALLPTRPAATVAGYSYQGFCNLRRTGGGPQFIRISPGKIRYTAGELRRWLKERGLYQSTREYAETGN